MWPSRWSVAPWSPPGRCAWATCRPSSSTPSSSPSPWASSAAWPRPCSPGPRAPSGSSSCSTPRRSVPTTSHRRAAPRPLRAPRRLRRRARRARVSSRWSTCASPTARRSSSSGTCRCGWTPGTRSRSWGPRGRARPPWSTCSCASTSSTGDASSSTGATSPP